MKASGYLGDALVGILEGDALHMFLHTSNAYTIQGFKKLAKLKDAFLGASQIQVAKEMFIFSNAYAQGRHTSLIFGVCLTRMHVTVSWFLFFAQRGK